MHFFSSSVADSESWGVFIEVEKARQAETATELELIKTYIQKVEMAFNREKCIGEDLTVKLQR